MKTIISSIILTSVMLVSCGGKNKQGPKPENKNSYEKIKSMNWLIGKWTMGNGDTLSTEIWQMKNDSVFSATSMDVQAGKDTLRYEDITIEQRGNEVYYIPVVKNQNGGKPVTFKLTSLENKSLVFENPEHDFPKKIMYELVGDTLFAQIWGPVNGHDVVMRFPMVKAK